MVELLSLHQQVAGLRQAKGPGCRGRAPGGRARSGARFYRSAVLVVCPSGAGTHQGKTAMAPPLSHQGATGGRGAYELCSGCVLGTPPSATHRRARLKRAGRDKAGRRPRTTRSSPDKRRADKRRQSEDTAKALTTSSRRAKPSGGQGEEARNRYRRCPEASPKTRASAKASRAGAD